MLDIRDEVWKDDAKSVVRRFGLEGTTSTDEYPGDYGPSPETYRWCSWETTTNMFTAYPAIPGSACVMYDDAIHRENTWYRDGKPNCGAPSGARPGDYIIVIQPRLTA